MVEAILLGLDTGFAVIGLGTVIVLTRRALQFRKALEKSRNGYNINTAAKYNFRAPTEDEVK